MCIRDSTETEDAMAALAVARIGGMDDAVERDQKPGGFGRGVDAVPGPRAVGGAARHDHLEVDLAPVSYTHLDVYKRQRC